MSELIVLVDKDDKELGYIEKMKAHEKEGVLHRAFSIFIVNSNNEMLIQQRSELKPLWGLFWANSCCSHPRKEEKLSEAIHRRLQEELGFDCELKELFTFIYQANFNNKGSEHELDHIFLGKYDKEVNVNLDEVKDWKWINISELEEDVKKNPDKYTPWFKIALPRVIKAL